MPKSPCLEPGCPELVELGRGPYCRDHAPRRARDYDEDARERNRFYARKRWAMARRRQLFEEPLCEYVEDGKRCGQLAEHVHHVIDLADGGRPYSPENLQSLCARHHSQITLERRRGGG